ncbi:thioredoxin [Candidatus Dependentiae bacterium]|nr:thioredoxin [Candidatus Dependentiae bacterium]
MSDQIVYLDSNNFKTEIENYNGTALVDFYADWCGPCRMLAPVIESLAKTYAGKIKICKVNTDNAQDIASKYNINGIPAVLIFKNGAEVENLVGFRPAEAYTKILNNYL